ncbi:MAG: hypothetical protein BM564_03045 [Bacteroidetes bacterium MedPE-SWsnd-G2]|nr:MAG: hypothetical protein BM564_03045 [Bacteroidetes bacterium MedPE-SWsnd-G2]
MRFTGVFLLFFLIQLNLFAQQTSNTTLISKDSIFHIRNTDLNDVAVSNSFDKRVIQLLGGSATGLMKRISGVNFASGNLVSFRGLSPRYSGILIDGLSAPITEQNVKAFSLGLLPGSAIQELKVNKSGSYENPGEWGGATVSISTNANLNKTFNKIAFGLGYQHNFTFETFIEDVDVNNNFGDFFGYGVDKRAITRDVVDASTLQNMSRNEAANQGKLLRNTYGLENNTAFPNLQFGYAMGRILNSNGNTKISTINSLSYSRGQSGAHYNRARFSGYNYNEIGEVVGSDLESYMTDGIYRTKIDLSLNTGWNFVFNSNNQMNFDVSYTHSNTNTTLSRYYVGLNNNKEIFAAQYGMEVKEAFLTRLTGTHSFQDATQLNWSLGYGNSVRKEPDLRRVGAQRNLNQPEAAFLMIIPESSKADNGARFNSDLNDVSFSGRVDVKHEVNEDRFVLKGGLISEGTDRKFKARILTTAKDDFTTPDLRFVNGGNLANVFAPENYGPTGYYLVDGTTIFDNYNADNFLLGGYVGSDYKLGKTWKGSLGFRVESFNQTMQSGSTDVDNSNTDFLTYLNFHHQLSSNSVLKLSYATSLNRPAFRELAPFTFYDFDYRADIQGNPELKNAKLQNLDFNILFKLDRNEYVSFGAFYKNIKDPIEMIYIIRSELALFSFNNAKGADLAGVEFEFSKYLSRNEYSVLHQILLNTNFAYTYSRIKLGEDTNEVASDRPLQGQTPFLAAAGLTYFAPNKKSQITVDYKFTGKSLFSVGDGQETFPWYNKSRHIMNLGYAYQFNNNLSLSLVGLNLLNAPFIQIEDVKLDGDLRDPLNKEVQKGLTYQTYNIILEYKF